MSKRPGTVRSTDWLVLSENQQYVPLYVVNNLTYKMYNKRCFPVSGYMNSSTLFDFAPVSKPDRSKSSVLTVLEGPTRRINIPPPCSINCTTRSAVGAGCVQWLFLPQSNTYKLSISSPYSGSNLPLRQPSPGILALRQDVCPPRPNR